MLSRTPSSTEIASPYTSFETTGRALLEQLQRRGISPDAMTRANTFLGQCREHSISIPFLCMAIFSLVGILGGDAAERLKENPSGGRPQISSIRIEEPDPTHRYTSRGMR